MKKSLNMVVSIFLILMCLLGLASCKEKATGLWAK